jgi:hypothetical protein
MVDFVRQLFQSVFAEGVTLISPLRRACRDQLSLYRFFLGMGWNLEAALGADLARAVAILDDTRRDLVGLMDALQHNDETAVLDAARETLTGAMERSRELYECLQAAAPVDVADEVIEAFVRDVAGELAVRYLGTRAPLLFQLAGLVGLVRVERPRRLTSTDGAVLLRYPIERLAFSPEALVEAAANPLMEVLQAIARMDGAEDLLDPLKPLQAAVEAKLRALLRGAGDRPLDDLELVLSAAGLRVSSGLLPRPPAGAPPIDLAFSDPAWPTLLIDGAGWTLGWPASVSPARVLSLFNALGVKFGLPTVADAGSSLTLSFAGGVPRIAVTGAFEIVPPGAAILDLEAKALRITPKATLRYTLGGVPELEIGPLELEGSFRIGGAGGVGVRDARLVLGAFVLPREPWTAAAPPPLAFSLSGTLDFATADLEVSLSAAYEDGAWTIESSGHATFGGVTLEPVGGKPVLALSTRLDAASVALAGAVSVPGEDVRVELGGAMTLRLVDGKPALEALELSGGLGQWKLSPDLTISDARLALGFAGGRVRGRMSGAVKIAEDCQLVLLDEIPPAMRRPGGPTETEIVFETVNGRRRLRVVAGFSLEISRDLMTDEGGVTRPRIASAGELVLPFDPAELPSLSGLAFEISAQVLRLGGAGGIAVEEPRAVLANAERLLVRTGGARPTLTLSGEVVLPLAGGKAGLGLEDGVFTFHAMDELPSFAFAEGGGMIVDMPDLGLPFTIEHARIGFKDAGAPVLERLRPENLTLDLTASLATDAFGDLPAVFGRLEGLHAEFDADGRPLLSVDGVQVGVTDLGTPPISAISGKLGIRNLLHPLDLELQGAAGGVMSGAGVKVNLSVRPFRPWPWGVCLDVNAGPNGIPLIYGFVVTGASGGMSFDSGVRDPCDFCGGSTPPAATPAIGAPKKGADPGCDCDCPPATMNILCQPHPDQTAYAGRAILKLSALKEDVWAGVPIPTGGGATKPAGVWLDELSAQAAAARPSPAATAKAICDGLKSVVAGLIPAVDPSTMRPQPQGAAAALLETFKDAYERPADYWARAAEARLAALLAAPPDPSLRRVVAEYLYRGIECPDLTLQVTGTFSYTGVSTFLSVTGGVNVSSSGAFGVIGRLNVLGVPLGHLNAFLTITSGTGDPEPGLCGQVRFEMGPIDLGVLCFTYRIPAMVTNLVEAVVRHGAALGAPLVAAVLQRIERADRPFAARAGHDPTQPLRSLTVEEGHAFIAAVLGDLRRPNVADAGRLARFAVDLASDLWTGFNPEIQACGAIAPKVFGIPLAELAQAGVRIAKDGTGPDAPFRLTAHVGFSPLYVLGRLSPIADMFSGADQAELAFALTLPTLAGLALAAARDALGDGAGVKRHLQRGLQALLHDSTMTARYVLHPLGLRLFDIQSRVVLPDLERHPARAGVSFTAPGKADAARVLAAALDAEKLADVEWRGDVAEVMPPGSGVTGDLQRDYFPHGGLLGAGRLGVPPLLSEAPPFALLREATAAPTVMRKLQAARSLIADWIVGPTTTAGALSFYAPFPTPPPDLLDLAAVDLDACFAALGRLADHVLDESELAFFQGTFNGRLFGLDLVDGEMVLTVAGGLIVRFTTLGGPLEAWFGAARFEAAVTPPRAFAGTPRDKRRNLERAFGDVLRAVDAAVAAAGAGADAALAAFARALKDELPRARLDGQAALSIPAALRPLLEVAAGAGARVEACSPFYDPASADRLQRDGGVRLRASMTVKLTPAVTVDAALEGELLAPSTAGAPARLTGAARLTSVSLPLFGLPLAAPAATLTLDTAPPAGEPLVRLAGECDALGVLAPLAGRTRFEALVSSGFTASLTLTPLRVAVPGLSPQTPLHLLPPAGESAIRLDGGGLRARFAAPAGLKLVAPGGGVIFEIGRVEGEVTRDAAGTMTFATTGAAGLTLRLFPGLPSSQSLPLPSEIVFTVTPDGGFSLSLAGLPRLAFAGGVLLVHAPGDPAHAPALKVGSTGLSTPSGAALSVEAGMTFELEAFRIGADGVASGRGRFAGGSLGGLIALGDGKLGFAVDGDGARLDLPRVAIEIPALGLAWTGALHIDRDGWSASVDPSATMRVDLGGVSVDTGAIEVRGSARGLKVTLQRPRVACFGVAADAPGAVSIELALQPQPARSPRRPRVITAKIGVTGTRPTLVLLASLVELDLAAATAEWRDGTWSTELQGRLRALRRPDSTTPGWLVDDEVRLALSSAAHDRLATNVVLADQQAVRLIADLGLKKDGAVWRAALAVSGTLLGVSLPPAAALCGAGGVAKLAWPGATMTLTPFHLKHAGTSLDADFQNRRLTLRWRAAELSAVDTSRWPGGHAPASDLELVLAAGVPTVKSYGFNGTAGAEQKIGFRVGIVGAELVFKVVQPNLEVTFELPGRGAGDCVRKIRLKGPKIDAEIRGPANLATPKQTLTLPDADISTNGDLTLKLPTFGAFTARDVSFVARDVIGF